MMRPTSFILIAIVTLCFGTATEAEGGILSARAGHSSKGVKFSKSCHQYRVNDRGMPLKCWCQQVTYRATNDTFVYRSRHRATARHGEISSPAIMFHLKGGKVRAGHVYARRGN